MVKAGDKTVTKPKIEENQQFSEPRRHDRISNVPRMSLGGYSIINVGALVIQMAEAGAPSRAIAIAVEAIEELQNADIERVNLQKEKAVIKTRARRQGISTQDWRELCRAVFRRDGKQCRYCGADDGKFHVDHVVPVSRGGSNDISNLVVACMRCNSSKGSKLLSEWVPPTPVNGITSQ